MNLVDTEQTPLHVPFDFIAEMAQEGGAGVTWSEMVGLVPERVLFDSARHYLKLDRFTPDQVLERQVSRAMRATEAKPTRDPFLEAVASSDPVPGGGSDAPYAGALAAALTRMVAGLTIGRKKYAAVEGEFAVIASSAETLLQRLSALVARDADAYAAVAAAYKLPKDGDETARTRAVDSALMEAADVPLETARACVEVATLAATAAAKGNANAVSDVGVAALLAEAGCRAAAYNVRINVKSLSDPGRGRHLAEEAESLVATVRDLSAKATEAVEKGLQS
jgi:glutamate formiminotransferase/formiminotetrahydrofolate cyclodeaminase